MTGRGWAAAAGDLLLGAECPGCRLPHWGLCRTCRAAASGFGAYLTCPDPCPPDFPVTVTTSPYDELMKLLVSAHKEHQVLSLTSFLGDRLAVAVQRLVAEHRAVVGLASVVLVPVPSSPAAVRARGLDATAAMARRATRRRSSGPQLRTQSMLELSRRVQDQSRLSAAARSLNLSGSLRVRPGRLPPGATVVIVDDVVTTGSSLSEAARALRAVGVPVLGAATVAATLRSSSAASSAKRSLPRGSGAKGRAP